MLAILLDGFQIEGNARTLDIDGADVLLLVELGCGGGQQDILAWSKGREFQRVVVALVVLRVDDVSRPALQHGLLEVIVEFAFAFVLVGFDDAQPHLIDIRCLEDGGIDLLRQDGRGNGYRQVRMLQKADDVLTTGGTIALGSNLNGFSGKAVGFYLRLIHTNVVFIFLFKAPPVFRKTIVPRRALVGELISLHEPLQSLAVAHFLKESMVLDEVESLFVKCAAQFIGILILLMETYQFLQKLQITHQRSLLTC